MQFASYMKKAKTAILLLSHIKWLFLVKKTGLGISVSSSLYLSGVFFWQMSADTITALVFLGIGLAAELGKYCAVVTATTHSREGHKWIARKYYLVTLILVGISVMGSAASLLKNDNHSVVQSNNLQQQIADVDEDISLERFALKKAASINAQSAGVKPARKELKELKLKKSELLEKQISTIVTIQPLQINLDFSQIYATLI